MNCEKCGSPNPEGQRFCKDCGASLGKISSPAPRKRKTGLIIGVAAGVLLLAGAAALALLLGKGGSPVGPWHNEELGQQIRFHEDETVVLRTPEGSFEATYLYDKKGSRGVITLGEQAIGFALDGEDLALSLGGVKTDFSRGELSLSASAKTPEPAAAQTPVPIPTAEPAAAPTQAPPPAPTPVPTTEPVVPTAAPAPEPTAAPTSAPTAAPAATIGPFVVVTMQPLLPMTPAPTLGPLQPMLPGNVLGTITFYKVIGTWERVDASNWKMVFYDDGTAQQLNGAVVIHEYTYTFSAFTGKGVFSSSGGDIPFRVDGDNFVVYDHTEPDYVRVPES